jgi:tetraacyldisaccharide 4'-kinase
VLSEIYAALARRRRRRAGTRQQHLGRPVISVGNLAVGGRGKTPMVATIARLLLDAGERPAILSRGYARTAPADGVVVVSDAEGLRADLPRAGDEPLMLARDLPGVPVLVCPNRYLAGRVAETRLGATVHILDDGFQHLRLARDVDIVLVGDEDVGPGARTLPAGRLREAPDALAEADAILFTGTDPSRLPSGLAGRVFGVRRTTGVPPGLEPGARVVALAGIARPERFFADVRAGGWTILRTLSFRDHHPYSSADVAAIWTSARTADAAAVLTTGKDLVRLLPFRPFPLPVAALPLTMEPDPLPAFTEWLLAAVRAARDTIVD